MRDFNSVCVKAPFGFVEMSSELDSQGLLKVEAVEDGTGDEVSIYLGESQALEIVSHIQKVFKGDKIVCKK